MKNVFISLMLVLSLTEAIATDHTDNSQDAQKYLAQLNRQNIEAKERNFAERKTLYENYKDNPLVQDNEFLTKIVAAIQTVETIQDLIENRYHQIKSALELARTTYKGPVPANCQEQLDLLDPNIHRRNLCNFTNLAQTVKKSLEDIKYNILMEFYTDFHKEFQKVSAIDI